MINYVVGKHNMPENSMPRLKRKIKSKNSFIINDNGKLVTIKQPNIMDLAILYQAIMINKQMINTIFKNSFRKSMKISTLKNSPFCC